MRLSARVNGVSRRHGQVSRNLWRELWPDAAVGDGADRPRHQRRAPGHLDGQPDHGAARRAPRARLGRPPRRAAALGPGAHARPRQALGGAPPAQARCCANFIREDARRRFAGQLKEAAQVVGAGTLLDPDGAHHRLRPAVRDLQARQPDLPRHRPAAAPAGRSVAPGADHLRRQGPPRRQPGQGSAAERLPVHPRPRVRGPGGVPRGLRHAPGPPAGAGRGSLAQPAPGAARGLGHQRDEGGAQRRAPAQHARRLVAGGLRWAERVGDLARRRDARTPTRPTPSNSTGCSRSRSSRSTTRATRTAFRSAGWRRCGTPSGWRAAGSPPGGWSQDYVQEYYAPAMRGDRSGDDPPTA